MQAHDLSVQQQSAAEQVAADIRRQILSGQIRMGSPLREVHLAEAFHISRNTLRESIQYLVRDGIVEHRANRGARVTRLDSAAASDIFVVRRVLELAALEHIVTRAPYSLSQLRTAVDELELAGKARDSEGIVDADIRFHRSLIDAFNSSRISTIYETIENQLRLGLSIVTVRTREFEHPGPLIDAHRLVIDALAAGDCESARQALLEHLSDAERMLLTVLEHA